MIKPENSIGALISDTLKDWKNKGEVKEKMDWEKELANKNEVKKTLNSRLEPRN